MVERFHRNKSKPANEDVAERVFLLAERGIEVTYHLEDQCFIPSKRSFIKPRQSTQKEKAEKFNPDMVSSFQVQRYTSLMFPDLRSLSSEGHKVRRQKQSQISESVRFIDFLFYSRLSPSCVHVHLFVCGGSGGCICKASEDPGSA